MNKLEQFIAVYEPQSDRNIGFKKMLDEIILETKNNSEHEIIGMRDYFAAKFIPVICKHSEFNGWNYENNAKVCYAMADAMMKARNDS